VKNSVTINGITLTREQVEGALTELNKPESPWVPEVGERFRSVDSSRIYIRLEDRAAAPLTRALWYSDTTTYPVVGVDANGRVNGFPTRFKFQKVDN
jgi:hypothetical protein